MDGRYLSVTQEKRLMTVEDINKIKNVNEPRISPDGKWIAYVLQTANLMKRGYDNNIYIVSTAGGEPIQITRSGKDSSPTWSPDSTRLAFVSSRNEKPQIFIRLAAHAELRLGEFISEARRFCTSKAVLLSRHRWLSSPGCRTLSDHS